MPKHLPKTKKFFTISETADFLGISIDTIRRYDKQGLITSLRLDGKNRYFTQAEIERFQANRKLSISEAAEYLHLSISTLRRLEKKGVIKAERNARGERMYEAKALDGLDLKGAEVKGGSSSPVIPAQAGIHSEVKVDPWIAPQGHFSLREGTARDDKREREVVVAQAFINPFEDQVMHHRENLQKIEEQLAQLHGDNEADSSHDTSAPADHLSAEGVSYVASEAAEKEEAEERAALREELFARKFLHTPQLTSPTELPGEKKSTPRLTFPHFLPTMAIPLFGVFMILVLAVAIFVLPSTSKVRQNIAAQSAKVTGAAVLADATKTLYDKLTFNIAAVFKTDTIFEKSITVGTDSTFNGNVVLNNTNLSAGTGSVTASNLLYSIKAGKGITVSGDKQNPTLSALSGFDTIKVGSDTLTPSSTATSNTLELAAGSNITLSTDTTNKKITITGVSSGTSSQWTTTGSDIYFKTGNVGIGTSSPGVALDVGGGIRASGAFTLSSLTTGILHVNGAGLVSSSTSLTDVTDVSVDLTPSAANTYNLGTAITNQYANVYSQKLYQNGSQVCDLSGNCSALSVNYWDQQAGVVNTKNATVDLLLGGTATASAKFAFINNLTGTPTASVSANSGNNALSLAGNGNITTTNRQTLTLGGGTSGNINLALAGSSNLLINGTAGVTQGSPSCVTTTNGIVTGFGTCQLGSEQWVVNSGAIYTGIPSLDLLLGGTSTASARFAVLNMAGGTPTASISGNSGNIATTIDGLGNIGTTNKQNLTLGTATTGSIVLNGFGTGVIQSNASGVLSSAALNLAGGASYVSGILPLANGGTGLNIDGTTITDGQILIGNNSTDGFTLANLTAGSGINISNGSGAITISQTGSGSSKWTQSGGVLFPNQATVSDLLLGGTSTASAKFAFINNLTGTPTASISANSGNNALYFDGLGNIATTNKQALTIGSSTTGNVIFNNGGNVGIGTTAPATLTEISSTKNVMADLNTLSNYNLFIHRSADDTTQGTGIAFGGSSGAFHGGGIGFIRQGSNSYGDLFFATRPSGGNVTERVRIDSNGNVGIGTTAPVGKLNIDGQTAGKALTILNYTGSDQNILVGSAAGTLAFAFDRNGNVSLGGSTVSSSNYITAPNFSVSTAGLTTIGSNLVLSNSSATTTFGGIAYTWPTSGQSNGYVLQTNGSGTLSWTSNSALGTNYWDFNNGALSPKQATVADLLLGGSSTASAKFAFINNLTGTPTASISANSGNIAMYLDGLGNIATTNKQNLTLGNATTTGNILLQGGNVGIGTTTPSTPLEVVTALGAGGLRVTRSGVAQYLSLNESAAADHVMQAVGAKRLSFINDLSTAGAIQFEFDTNATTPGGGNRALVITTEGNVGIGTVAPLGKLNVNGQTAGQALVQLNQTGNQDIFVASQGGATKFVIGNTGAVSLVGGLTSDIDTLTATTLNIGATNTTTISLGRSGQGITLPGFTGQNGVLFGTQTTGVLAQATTSTAGLCLTSGASNPTWTSCSGAAGTTQNYWQLNSGALSPFTNSADLLLGGTSTASAKFAFINNLAGSPTASIAGNFSLAVPTTAGANTFNLLNGSTLNFQSSVGGDAGLTSRLFINGNTGNVGIGTTTPTAKLDVNGSLNVNGTLLLPNTAILITSGGNSVLRRSSNIYAFQSPGAGAFFQLWNNTGASLVSVDNNGNVGIGTTAPVGLLNVEGQVAGKSLVTLNQTGNQDIFTASQAGATKFVIGNTGAVSLVGGLTSDLDTLTATTFNIGATNATTISLGRSGQGITLPGFTGQNGVLFGTQTTGVLAQATTASTGLCLVSGASNPTWSSCSGAAGTTQNYWQLNSGALSPFTNSADLLLGGTSTASAKFGFINNLTGTPTASISGNSGNIALSIDGLGNIGTTNKQNLTLGNSNTGNVIFNNGGNVGIGATAPANKLVVAGTLELNTETSPTAEILYTGATAFNIYTNGSNDLHLGTNNAARLSILGSNGSVGIGNATPVAKLDVNGQVTGKALTIFNQTGDQAILTGSVSGSTKFTITNGGNIGFAGGTSFINTLASAATAARTYTFPDADGTVCLSSNNCTGSGLWNAASGAIFEGNVTQDLLLGGTSTASAKFAFINNLTGTPTASISGNSGNNALSIDGLGNIATTNKQNLTLGNSSTGNIILNGGNVGIGTTTPTVSYLVDINGGLHVNGVIGTSSGVKNDGTSNNAFVQLPTTGTLITRNIADSNPVLITQQLNASSTGDIFQAKNSATTLFVIGQTGNVGIGTTAPVGKLNVDGQVAGKSLVTFNQTGDQDIFTASQGGTTKFRIANDGTVLGGATNTYDIGASGTTFRTGYFGTDLVVGGSSVCRANGTNCPAGSTSYWDLAAGALRPTQASVVDLLLGGTSTASAKFAFINNLIGTPTASISGNSGNIATYLTGTGKLATTNGQNLVLGDSTTTGNIILNPAGNVGIGTTTPGTLLEVAKNLNGLGSYAANAILSTPQANDVMRLGYLDRTSGAATAQIESARYVAGGGYLALRTNTTGDGGMSEGLRLDNAGNVGIGITLPLTRLHIQGTADNNSYLRVDDSAGVVQTILGSTNSGGYGFMGTLSNHPLVFRTNNTGVAAFGTGGNFGVGTTSPTNGRVEIQNSTNNFPALFVQGGGSAASSTIRLQTDSDSTNPVFEWKDNSSGQARIGAFNYLNSANAAVGQLAYNFGTHAMTFNTNSATRLTISSTGILTTAAYTTNGGLLYTDGSGVVGQTGAGTSGQVLKSNAGGAPTWIDPNTSTFGLWDQLAGALRPKNTTVDLLLGGTATTSAKFAFINNLTGTPTASVSAGNAGALYLDATGKIATTAKQGLTLGDSTTTGNISLLGGNVGIGTTAPNEQFMIYSATDAMAKISGLSGNAFLHLAAGAGNAAQLAIAGGNTFFDYQGNWNIRAGINGAVTILFDANGNVGIGTTVPVGKLNVDGQVAGKSLVTFNQTGDQDIFTASQGGTTKFRIANDGTVLGGATNTYDIGASGTTFRTGYFGTDLVVGGSSVCRANGTNCPAGGTNYWDLISGALRPTQASVVDLLLGGTSTASAKFAFINNLTGTPTASISANSGNGALFIKGDGTLATTNMQGLTIGSSTTGDVIFNNAGAIGIGTTTPKKYFPYNKVTVVDDTGGANSDFVFYVPGGSGYAAMGLASSGGTSASPTASGSNDLLGQYNFQGFDGTDFKQAAAIYARVSGSVSTGVVPGELYFETAGSNGTLTPRMYINSTGSIGMGTTAPSSQLQVTRLVSNGATGKALAVFDQLESQDIFTASAAGTPKFTINNSGYLAIAGSAVNASNYITAPNFTVSTAGLTTMASNLVLSNSSATTTFGGIAYTWPTSGQVAGYTLTTNGSGTLSWAAAGSSNWDLIAGALRPKQASSVDLLLGGTSTASAKFAFVNNLTGTPTASISGNSGNIALSIDGLGNIATTNRQALTLGNTTTTGNINILGGNVGIGTTTPGGGGSLQAGAKVVDIVGAAGQNAFLRILGGAGGTKGGLIIGNNDGSGTNYGQFTFDNNANTFTINQLYTSGYLGLGANSRTADLVIMSTTGSVGIGTTAPQGLLHVNGGNFGGNAVGIFNQTGASTADIFTASAAGAPKFTIANDGTMKLYGSSAGNVGLKAAASTTSYTLTLPGAVAGGSNYALVSDNAGTASWLDTSTFGSNYWNQLTNGSVLLPKFASVADLLLGGTSTASAKFAFINNLTGTPTASISGNSGNIATTIDGLGNIGTTNRQDLVLGTATTGNLSLKPGGSTALTALSNGNIGIGITTPLGLLNVSGQAAGKALVGLNQVGDQAIFTASQAGTTKFTIANNGDVVATSSGVTTDAFSFNASATTTGNAFKIQANALTTGNGLSLIGNALTTGYLANLSSTSTALTTGGLMALDWSPGSSTTATGDLLSLNIGANGILGNIFNVKDNGSSVFSVSQTAVTSNLPVNFTSPGDVSMSYDLNFTNPTASYINSIAPLYIRSGETFNSSDLTLTTYNKGNVQIDSEVLNITKAATVSGQLVLGTTTATAGQIGQFYARTNTFYGKALGIFDQYEAQDIFTASAAGAPKFTIANDGTMKLYGATSGNVGIKAAASTTSYTLTLPGAVAGGANYALVSDGSGTGSWIAPNSNTFGLWDLTAGALLPKQPSVVDLLLGGTSTASAKFAFINNLTGTPTASISGNSGNIATYLSGTGKLATTNGQNLVLGDSTTTGNVIINPSGNVGIGTTNPGQKLQVAGAVVVNGTGDAITSSTSYTSPSTVYGALHLAYDTTNKKAVIRSVSVAEAWEPLYFQANEFRFSTGTSGITEKMALDTNGNLGIGTTAPTSLLHLASTSVPSLLTVSGSSIGKALTVLNQTSPSQDIFTASAGGVTKFTIGNNGDITATSSATTSNALSVVANTMTTGNVLFASTSGALTSGNLISGTANGTYTVANASVSGNLLNLNRSLTMNEGTAAITFDAASTTTADGANSATWSHTVGTGSNRILVVGVSTFSGSVATVNSVTFNGQNLTQAGTQSLNATTRSEIWYMYNPPSTTANIVVTLSGTQTKFGVGATSWSNVSQSSIGTFQSSTGTSSTPSITATSATNEMVVENVVANSGVLSVTGSQTQRYNNSNSAGSNIAGAASVVVSWSNSGGSLAWVDTAVSLKPATGGALTISGALASLTSNCTVTNGACNDTSNILSLNQSYGSATGAVFNITSSGFGSMLNVSGSSKGNAAAIINQNSTTMDIFAASSSGLTKFLIGNSGNVNIGTQSASTTPYKLYVSDYQAATASAMIENTANNGAQCKTGQASACHTGLIIKMGQPGSGTAMNDNDQFINFMRGDGRRMGYIGGGANSITYNTVAADFAEYFAKADPSENIVAGDVVCYKGNGVAKCDGTTGEVVGVVSDTPGFVGGEAGPDKVVVGLIGQVNTKVRTDNGTIKAGDPITYSAVAGVATKATRPGMLIGRALSDYSGSEQGSILLLVRPGWFDPTLNITDAGILSTQNGPLPTDDSLMSQLASTPLPTSAGIGDVRTRLNQITDKLAQLESKVNTLGATASAGLDASSSAALSQTQGAVVGLTSQVAGMQSSVFSLQSAVDNLASTSAFMQQTLDQVLLSASQSASLSQTLSDLSVQAATVSGNLMVLGRTTVSDLGVTGNITAGIMSINGLDGAINTIGQPLKIQSNGFYGLDFLNGKVQIATNGDITTVGKVVAKEVETKKVTIDVDPVASGSAVLSASAGTATIPAGDTYVDVQTTALSNNSLIFTTPDTAIAVGTKKINANTFRITIDGQLYDDLNVNWWIIDKKVTAGQ